jgi:hypothetical protein
MAAQRQRPRPWRSCACAAPHASSFLVQGLNTRGAVVQRTSCAHHSSTPVLDPLPHCRACPRPATHLPSASPLMRASLGAEVHIRHGARAERLELRHELLARPAMLCCWHWPLSRGAALSRRLAIRLAGLRCRHDLLVLVVPKLQQQSAGGHAGVERRRRRCDVLGGAGACGGAADLARQEHAAVAERGLRACGGGGQSSEARRRRSRPDGCNTELPPSSLASNVVAAPADFNASSA